MQGTAENLLGGFLNFVTSAGWDLDKDGTVDVTVKGAVENLLKYVAGKAEQYATIDQGFTTLTTESIQGYLPIDGTNKEMSYELIEYLSGYVNDPAIFEGKTAYEALQIMMDILDMPSLGLNQFNSYDLTPEALRTGAYESLPGLLRPIFLSFGASADMNLDVMDWAKANLGGFINTDDPAAVEQTIRNYLEQEYIRNEMLAEQLGISLSLFDNIPASGNLDPSELKLNMLLLNVQIQNEMLQKGLHEQGLDLIEPNPESESETPISGGERVTGLLSDSGLIPEAFQFDPNQPQPTPLQTNLWMREHTLRGIQTAFDPKTDYQRPPDYNLLVFVLSMVAEPLFGYGADAILSVGESIIDIARGDLGGAAFNLIAAALPILAGSTDEVVQAGGRVADEVVDDIEFYRNYPQPRPFRVSSNDPLYLEAQSVRSQPYLRRFLGTNPGDTSNLGLLEFSIDGEEGVRWTIAGGVSKEKDIEAAASGLGMTYGGVRYIPKASDRLFETKKVMNYDRSIDTEAKLLEGIAKELNLTENSTGTIRLYTDRYPCESCGGIWGYDPDSVIGQFMAIFPNIEVEVIYAVERRVENRFGG